MSSAGRIREGRPSALLRATRAACRRSARSSWLCASRPAIRESAARSRKPCAAASGIDAFCARQAAW
ncbi:hypothetical protein ACFQ9X_06865 [Catenulispora yoronensis]